MVRRQNVKNKKVLGLVVILVALILIGAGIFIFRDKLFRPKYPLDYTQSIKDYSNLYNLDPYFICAVINTESGFNKDAVSPAGAIGLMQIMPETGEWIASKLSVSDFENDQLFIPELNIQFGCWYLGFLQERFNGDMQLISAAYNAGHNRVMGWMDDETLFNDGKLINIPFEETENYVKRVENAYNGYKKDYPDVFNS